MGLDKQNNNFARASRFFAHFAAVVARLLKQLNLYLPTFDELRDGISANKFQAAQIHFVTSK